MLLHRFNLSLDQPEGALFISELQDKLYSAGILLSLALSDDLIQLTIAIPEDGPAHMPAPEYGSLTEKHDEGSLISQDEGDGSCKCRRGRKPAVPSQDISLAQALQMNAGGTSLADIANYIGVSRRTFFRRWSAAQASGIDPETPFSDWPL